MRQSAHRIVESGLALMIAGLLAVALVPWRRPALPAKAAEGDTPSAAPAGPRGDAISTLPIEVVLRLFVERPVAMERTPAITPPREPQEAYWLKYMGFASTSDGRSSWYVKDTRTGKLIRASQGEARGGWTVVECTSDRLVLKNGDDLFSVKKR